MLAYWQSKYKKNSNRGDDSVEALFAFDEPSIQRVGYLIPLQCGHNGKLERLEVALLSVHLELAGFL
jgi:hypothetical protein